MKPVVVEWAAVAGYRNSNNKSIFNIEARLFAGLIYFFFTRLRIIRLRGLIGYPLMLFCSITTD